MKVDKNQFHSLDFLYFALSTFCGKSTALETILISVSRILFFFFFATIHCLAFKKCSIATGQYGWMEVLMYVRVFV